MAEAKNILSPEFRVSFSNVFEARKNELSGKMEFGLVALFALGANLDALKAAARQVIVDKFGPDPQKWPTGLRNPFRDQGEKVRKDGNGVPILGTDGKPVLQDGHVAGAVFLNLKSQQKPGIVDENVQDIIDPSRFYSGCWARATIRPYYYDQKGNKGVAFGLQNVQKLRDDDPLGGRTTAQQDFKPVEGATPVNTGAPATANALFG